MTAILPRSCDRRRADPGRAAAPTGFGRLRAALVALAVASRVSGTGRTAAHPFRTPFQTTTEACPVANIKSQIKRNRQNEVARERNKAVKTSLKTAIRRFREAADAGDA